jgi:conjugative relaxase-like TrwC/TraI family protein
MIMLSLKNVSGASAAASYYEKDNYYTNSDEQTERSSWWGRGAEVLGLSGPVDPQVFEQVLNGDLPNGEEIRQGTSGRDRVGIDATFSAPKSVSLLSEVGGDERLRDAHERAVTRALEYVQDETAEARIMVDGERSVERTGNFIVARFEHDTSRAHDPQVHTHAVIVNATQRSDGAWRALSNESLFEHKMAAGAVYRAELAVEVQKLGYEVERTGHDGRFEIAGFQKADLEQFSQRASTIREAMQERGLEGSRAAERATLMTRESKSFVPHEDLLGQWRERAQAMGLNLDHIMEQAKERAGTERPLSEARAAAIEAVRWATEHLAERQSVFAKGDVERYATQQIVGKGTFQDVQEAIATMERGGELIQLGATFTTYDALKTEQYTIDLMREGARDVAPLMSREQAEQVVEGRSLTEGQARAVVHILSSDDRFLGVEGRAGTGKTTMLNVTREFSEQQGYNMRGLAISANAARTLETESGIRSQTIAQFLAERHMSSVDAGTRESRTIYVLDESSLIGARDARDVMNVIRAEGARGVFMGDRVQLGAVQAGKPFAVLVDKGMRTEQMSEIVRQRNQDLRAVVEKAAGGRGTDTVTHLEQSGRIVEMADRSSRLEAVAQAYLEHNRAGEGTALVLTGSRTDRSELNDRIRDGLRQEGALTGKEVRAEVLVAKDLTKAQIKSVESYSEGDVIRFGREYRSVGISKGEYGRVIEIQADHTIRLQMEGEGRTVVWTSQQQPTVEVYRLEERALQTGDSIRWTRNNYSEGYRNGDMATVRIDSESGAVTAETRGGRAIVMDPSRDRHWDYGYASTVAGSQGRTVDRVLYHADSEQVGTNQEAYYVALSRARDEVRVFTDNVTSLKDAVQESRGQSSAIEAVEGYVTSQQAGNGSDRGNVRQEMQLER